jgi:hypothetical protein
MPTLVTVYPKIGTFSADPKDSKAQTFRQEYPDALQASLAVETYLVEQGWRNLLPSDPNVEFPGISLAAPGADEPTFFPDTERIETDTHIITLEIVAK